MGLTQSRLAELLGVEPNSVARRERGERPISREAELAIRALAAARRRSAVTGCAPRKRAGRVTHDPVRDVRSHVPGGSCAFLP
jgi:transcriptional regulator with XRE-family HTH domain